MYIKRTLCIVLSVLLFVNFALTLCVSAAREPEVSPLWNSTGFVSFRMGISGKTAYIDTDIDAKTDDATIQVVIQLYYEYEPGKWTTEGMPSITHTATGRIGITDTVTGLKSGNYKAVMMAYVSNANGYDYIGDQDTATCS